MIDYSTIASANLYYAEGGFTRVEIPWTVTQEISDITKPKGCRNFSLVHDNGKCLVASAEQSFLYQYAKGFLPLGRFQATTPCFRFENHDALHAKTFIKTELIVTDDVSATVLAETIDLALEFFKGYFPSEGLVVVSTGDNAFDINFNGDELGSYGIRECAFLKWIYATGAAEPRTSMIQRKYGIPQN